jgi:hypothetical protein
VRTTEELLGRNSSGSGLENRDKLPWESVALTTRHTLSAKDGATSLTSGGWSVGIVRGLKQRSLVLVFNSLVLTESGAFRAHLSGHSHREYFYILQIFPSATCSQISAVCVFLLYKRLSVKPLQNHR